MPAPNDTKAITAVFVPSDKEVESIKAGIAVLRVEGKSTYHKWQDVFDDKLFFRSLVQPHDQYLFRAVAITVPMYHEVGVPNSVYPNGFVYGVAFGGAASQTILSPLSSLKWINAPTS